MVDPLGTWGASKPSDGLGIKIPQYSYFDMVQANYRLLRDKLNVARVALVNLAIFRIPPVVIFEALAHDVFSTCQSGWTGV